jgi:hypothetical protein
MGNKEREKHQEIADKLKEMPKMQDTRDKEAVYTRISSQINNNSNRTTKKKKFIPITSAVAAALIFIILMPVFFDIDMQQTSEEDMMNQSGDMEMQEANDDNSSIQDYHESSDDKESQENDRSEQEINIMQTQNESLVVQDINQNENLYFAGLSDIQEQYVIPISFISSGEWDLQSFYNNMDEFVSEWENSTGEYLFENVEFQINQSDNEIALELPDDFSLDGGSARANMFEDLLATMFRPYGTEKVTIQTDDGEPAEIDPFGEITELLLPQVNPSSYKIYEVDNFKMLIQIPKGEQTGIEEAIMEMKEDEAEFHVFKTVPDHIEFTIEPENKQLNFRFSDTSDLTENQDSIEMIEAVLMTAKSYGYEEVSFENTDKEYIGPYNLTEPIPVPEAVNPIYLGN